MVATAFALCPWPLKRYNLINVPKFGNELML